MDWWVGPLVTLLVAVLGASGVWLTVWTTRRAQQQSRLEIAEKRGDQKAAQARRMENYAAELRDHIYQGKPPPPPPWPDDLYE